MSLRSKLILLMTLVVAGVTGTTIFLTRLRLSDAWRSLFRDQFVAEFRYFSEEQERRLDQVADHCEKVAADADVIAAMKQARPGDAYDAVFDGFRDILRAELPQPAAALARETERQKLTPVQRRQFLDTASRRLREAPFIRLLDGNGQEFKAPDERFGRLGRYPLGKNTADRMKKLLGGGRRNDRLTEQEIGYLALEAEDGGLELREFIITPIHDGEGGPIVGALLVAPKVRDFGDRRLRDYADRVDRPRPFTGLWLSGVLHATNVPDSEKIPVGSTISTRMAAKLPGTEDVEMTIQGVPYLLIYRVLNEGSPFGEACHFCLFSMQAALDDEQALTRQAALFGAIALASAVGFIFFISHRLTHPIRSLVRATGEIRKGNFEVQVPVKSRDEVGQLAGAFNGMVEGLALNRRYHSLLEQVADPAVAQALIAGGIALKGEKRPVSVLFCDIRGFTSMTAGMEPTEVIDMLNEHMTALTQVVYAHGGVVDKFVGDLVMAVFGAPQSAPDDPARAVRCALAMVHERHLLNGRSRWNVRIGIGVATGEAVAGCMGSPDRLDYTVLGERVNLAARLCGEARADEILVDESTAQAAREAAEFRPTGPLMLKGYPSAIKAWIAGPRLETAGLTVSQTPGTAEMSAAHL